MHLKQTCKDQQKHLQHQQRGHYKQDTAEELAFLRPSKRIHLQQQLKMLHNSKMAHLQQHHQHHQIK